VARYNGPEGTGNKATAVAVSPTGKTVFVTGSSGPSYATVAYNPATGAQLWAARYGSGPAAPVAMAVSPDGGTVFVTGSSKKGTGTGSAYLTVAYNATTGAVRWAARYSGAASKTDAATSVAVSRDGTEVFVTGSRYLDQYDGYESVTLAYNAASGARVWAAHFDFGGGAVSLAVSPKDGTVYVTGILNFFTDPNDRYDTIAYNPATGAQLWETAYGGQSGFDDIATSTTAGAAGTLYVTGSVTHSTIGDQTSNYLTVCINSAGTLVWEKTYNGPASDTDTATSVAVSRNGSTVYVTGSSQGNGSGADYATIAYNTHTGAKLWVKRYNGPGNGADAATSIAVSRDQTKVFVTGQSLAPNGAYDYATVAYAAATGARLWVRRYNGPGNSDDVPAALAVSPTAGSLFVTGYSDGSTSYTDYATIAYSG
jgi:DNA-binding beta-propeller fold protein YncE